MKNNTYTSFTMAQIGQVVLDEMGSDLDKFYFFRKSGLLTDLLKADPLTIDREEFRKVIGLLPVTLRITVRYWLSFKEMIVLGRYDIKDRNITEEQFPLEGRGEKELIV